jgi:hypothetical protein
VKYGRTLVAEGVWRRWARTTLLTEADGKSRPQTAGTVEDIQIDFADSECEDRADS